MCESFCGVFGNLCFKVCQNAKLSYYELERAESASNGLLDAAC